MLINQMAVFTTNRAYEAGELIERASLTRVETENPPANALTKWPTGVVTASDYLEANHTLSKSNIEQSEYVIVTATNIIGGRVITRKLNQQNSSAQKANPSPNVVYV